MASVRTLMPDNKTDIDPEVDNIRHGLATLRCLRGPVEAST
ncbi:hypothetical protein [Variovorax sp. GB4R4]